MDRCKFGKSANAQLYQDCFTCGDRHLKAEMFAAKSGTGLDRDCKYCHNPELERTVPSKPKTPVPATRGAQYDKSDPIDAKVGRSYDYASSNNKRWFTIDLTGWLVFYTTLTEARQAVIGAAETFKQIDDQDHTRAFALMRGGSLPVEQEAKSGWVRYWLSGRGGHGYKVDKWIYSPAMCHEDYAEDVLDYIMRSYESWALHAESVSYEIETNAKPPVEEIEKAIKVAESNAKAYQDEAKELAAQLNYKRTNR